MLPIFIISLKTAIDRRLHITRQFKKHNLVFEWFDAIDSKTVLDDELSGYIDAEAVKKHPTWLTKGAICCALSHYHVYQIIIERNLPYALVLEDDVILKNGFIKVLEQAVLHLRANEIISLYNHNWAPLYLSSLETVQLPNCKLYEPINVEGLGTTAAYLISLSACKSMVSTFLPVRCAADSWDVFYKAKGYQNFRFIYPEIVDTADFKSTIEYVENKKLSFLLGLIDKHKIFPFFQMLKLRRTYNKRKIKKISILPMPSFTATAKAQGE